MGGGAWVESDFVLVFRLIFDCICCSRGRILITALAFANLGDILPLLQFIHLSINHKYHYKIRLLGGGITFLQSIVFFTQKLGTLVGWRVGLVFGQIIQTLASLFTNTAIDVCIGPNIWLVTLIIIQIILLNLM